MTLGLVVAVVLANGSIIKAIAMVFLGVLFGLAGTDSATNAQRYTFGIFEMSDGIDFSNLEQRTHAHGVTPISSLWPSREDIRRSIGPVLRGTAIGSFLGVLPGGGPTLAAFSSYAVEKYFEMARTVREGRHRGRSRT
jgi:TctA family transporter